MRIDVADLAHAEDFASGVGEPIEKGRLGWQDRIVLAVAGARKVLSPDADERPRDDSADIERQREFTRYFADLIEPFEPEALLMGRNLDDGICGRIDDWFPGPRMLFAE